MIAILCAHVVLWVFPMAGKVAAGIHLVDVRFKGETRLDGVDLDKCANDFKSHIYEGTQWTDHLAETLRARCLLNKGYFKAAVQVLTRQLPDKEGTHQFIVTFDIDAGPRCRLAKITFTNNRAISNAKALRNQFPIKDGDSLDRNAIAKGLENLRYAYQELGYINFTPVPELTFDDQKKLGFLTIYIDEGIQYSVSRINIVGADPQVLNDLLVKPGQIYNVRLIDLFLRKHLPGADVNDPRIQHLLFDERNGTVALTFDFTRGRQ